MEKLFLLDAYALIYRAYYGFIKNPRINSKGENTSAVLGFVNTLEEILRTESPTHIGVAFDPKGGTFRHEIYPEYKAQREETPEAIRFAVPIIKQILEAYNIPVLEVAGFEADDVIGTLATKAGEQGILTYMMTPDKDYGQLVRENVFMYRPKHDKGFEVMGPKEVCEKFGISKTAQVIDILGLMGDSADNIPGCPGVGPKTATKLIDEFGTIEDLVESTDKLKGALKTKVETNKEQILFSKFLATIKLDVPVELNMKELERKKPNEEELRKIFNELEFRNLTERIFGKSEKTEKIQKNPKTGPIQGDLFGEFATNGTEEIFSRNLTKLSDIQFDYQLVDSVEKRKSLCDFLLTKQILSLDTETTSTDSISAKLVGLSFSVEENKAFYVPVPQDQEEARAIVNEFKEVYENVNSLKVGQNIKYDMNVLANYGIELGGKLFDTMLAHYLLHPENHHNMDYLAEVYLNYETIHIDELIGSGRKQKNMADLSPADICNYAAEDADVTLKLKNILEKELQEKELTELFETIEMPLVRVLSKMERNGARINTESLAETSRFFTTRMDTIESEIHQLAGCDFNIASPRQVGEILFDKLKITDKAKKTKTGQYVTSEEVLQSLKTKHPIVEKILEHRGLKKLIGTYVDALPKLINSETGRIHTSYNQAVTATGRLSSSNPNLQNIPIRDEDGKEIRKAFIPDDNCQFFSADYSQIELRIMAHLSGDENMIEAFCSGDDIHAATAAKVYKKPIEEVTKSERSKAKTANFGIIYGISAFGLAERMDVSRSEAKQLIDGYFATYPKVKEYMDRCIALAREKGYTETIFGRRCYLPDINSHNSVVRGYAERNAINSPIQGSAADIIKIAMIRIYERMEKEQMKSKMILQVHDELNFSVYADEHDKLEQIVVEEMQGALKMKVPLIAESGWGTNWLEAH